MASLALIAAALLWGLSSPARAVEYTVVFEGLWDDAQVAEGPLPGGAHFTNLIGASHEAGHPLWQAGGV